MCNYTTVYNVARQEYSTGLFFYHAMYLSITLVGLVNFSQVYIFNNTKKICGAAVARSAYDLRIVGSITTSAVSSKVKPPLFVVRIN